VYNGVVWSIATIVFVTDFFIKSYFARHLAFRSCPLIKNILHISVVFNRGAAFGFFSGKTNLLICVGIIFILLFLVFIKREGKKSIARQKESSSGASTGRSPIFLISCGLILGGALSNLYDRIFLGYVVDYIDIRIWPVFNLSDSCISIGVALLILNSFKRTNARNEKL
jgi:signal peptidase II